MKKKLHTQLIKLFVNQFPTLVNFTLIQLVSEICMKVQEIYIKDDAFYIQWYDFKCTKRMLIDNPLTESRTVLFTRRD